MIKTYFKPVYAKRKDLAFSKDDVELFYYNYACWECGLNSWDCLHHIIHKEVFPECNSPLNAAPLHNYSCHIGRSFNDDTTNKYLSRTLGFLYNRGYRLTAKDRAFIERVKHRYTSTTQGRDLLINYKISSL